MKNVRYIALRKFTEGKIDAIQAQYLNEPCIRVSVNDEPLGDISKKECHLKGILHRAFSVFLFNKEQKLLLQKRSSTKITFPNLWTNSCCSHPHFNKMEMEENEESVGIQRAAYRKLNHELGIYPSQLGRMHIMGKFLYKAKSDDVWSEHEMDYAIVISNFEGNINPNPEEVSDTRYVNQEELISLMSNNSFSPWFRLFHSHKWLSLWWNTLENLELNKESSAIHKLN